MLLFIALLVKIVTGELLDHHESTVQLNYDFFEVGKWKSATSSHQVPTNPERALDDSVECKDDFRIGGRSKWWQVDLEYEYNIFYVVIKSDLTIDFQINVMRTARDTYGRCTPISNSKMFACNGMEGRYVRISSNQYTLQLCNVKIYSKKLAPASKVFIPVTMMGRFEPSSFHQTQEETDEYVVTFDASHLDELNFATYDNIPMAFYIIAFPQNYHVFSMHISSAYKAYSFFISHRVDEDREFSDYQENDKKKMFQNENALVDDLSTYDFPDPLFAKDLRVHLMFQSTKLKFSLQFEGLLGTTYYSENHYIHSGMMSVSRNTKVEYTSISFPSPVLISGIKFDKSFDKKHKFFLEYSVDTKWRLGYRDNPNLSSNTLFFFTTSWISIRPAVAKTLIIIPIAKKWNGEEVFGVHLKGQKQSLDSFSWPGQIERISTNPNHTGVNILNDDWYRNPLFGNMKNLGKKVPNQCVQTNTLGASCFTRPHLCDSGFTISLVYKGGWRNELTEKIYTVADEDEAFPHKYNESETLTLFFKNPIFYNYLEIKEVALRFHCKREKNMSFTVAIAFQKDKKDLKLIPIDIKFTYQVGFGWVLADLTSQFRSRFLELLVSPFIIIKISPLGKKNTVMSLSNIKLALSIIRKTVHRFERLKVDKELFGDYLTKGVFTEDVERKRFHIFELKCCSDYAIDRVTVHGQTVHEETTIELQIFAYDGVQCLGPLMRLTHVKSNINEKDRTIIFEYPLALNKICLLTNPNRANTKFTLIGSTTAHHLNQFFPILSSGIQGDAEASTGSGLAIYLRPEETLEAIVKTNTSQYTVSFKIPKFEEVMSKFTIVWNKKSLKMYLGGKKVGTSSRSSFSKTEKPNFMQEYLLVFCDYQSLQSSTNAQISKIHLQTFARTTFDQERDSVIRELVPFTSKINFPKGFHLAPFCFCWNAICPCDAQEEEIVVVKEKRYFLVEEVIGHTLRETMYPASHFDLDLQQSVIEFNNIILPNPYIDVTNAYLSLSFNKNISSPSLCNLHTGNINVGLLWFFNDSYKGFIYKSPDIKELIIEEAKVDSQLSTVRFYLSRGCLETGVEIQDGYLNISYNSPSEDVGVAAPAFLTFPVHYDVPVNLDDKCLSFQLMYEGSGFAFLSVLKVQEIENISKEVIRIYTKNKPKKWNKMSLSLSQTSYSKVQITGIKNGKGEGYFWVKNLVKSNDICDDSPTESLISTTDDFENLRKMMFLNGFPLPTVFLPASKNVLPVGKYTNHIDCIQGTCEIFNSLFYPQGYSFIYTISNKSDSTIISFDAEVSREFTMAFWVKETSNNFITLKTSNGTILYKMNFQRNILNVNIILIAKNLSIELTPSESGWYHVIFTQKRYKAIIYENPELKFEEVSFLTHEVNLLETQVRRLFVDSYRVHCFQLYDHVLSEFEMVQTQICPNRFTTSVCEGEASTCGVCNQLTGEWQLPSSKTQMYSATDTTCTHGIKKINDLDSYITFDTNEYGQLLDVYRESIKIQTDPNSTVLVPGVANNAICFERSTSINMQWKNYSDNFTLSFWAKYHCQYKKTNLILSFPFLKLYCNSDGRLLVHRDECQFHLKQPSGLWFHLAMLSSQRKILFYVDGALKDFSESCGHETLEGKQELESGNLPVCIDELLITDRYVSSEEIEDIFSLYLDGIDDKPGNVKAHQIPYYFKYFIVRTAWHDDLLIRGSFHYQSLIDKIKRQITEFSSNKRHIRLIDSSKIKFRAPNDREDFMEATLAIYFRQVTRKIVEDLENVDTLLISHGENVDLLLKAGYNFLQYEIASTSDYKVLSWHKTYVVIRWIQKQYVFKLPVKKIRIVVTRMLNKTSPSTLPNQTSVFETKNVDVINITSLEVFTLYKICFEPIPWRGSTNAPYLCSYKANFLTEEGEPNEEPDIVCYVKNSFCSKCNMSQISSWVGTPYSYEVFWKWTKDFLQRDKRNIHREYNFTSNGFNQLEIRYNPNVTFYGLNITNDLPYENYTVIVRATTRRGKGKGIYKLKYFRTGEGAPEKPRGLEIKLENGTVVYMWNNPGKDVEYWNTDLRKSDSWQFVLTYGKLINKTSVDVYLPWNVSKHIAEDANDDAEIYFGFIRSASNGIFGERTESSMLLLPILKKPTVSFHIEVDPPSKATTISMSIINFSTLKWRGKKKYFVFLLSKSSLNINAKDYMNKKYFFNTMRRVRRSLESNNLSFEDKDFAKNNSFPISISMNGSSNTNSVNGSSNTNSFNGSSNTDSVNESMVSVNGSSNTNSVNGSSNTNSVNGSSNTKTVNESAISVNGSGNTKTVNESTSSVNGLTKSDVNGSLENALNSKDSMTTTLPTTESPEPKRKLLHLQPSSVNTGDYWIKAYTLAFEYDFDIESFAGQSIPTNISLIQNYLSQDIFQTIFFNGLHPWTKYKVSVIACNEIGCQDNGISQYVGETTMGRPRGAPNRVKIKRDRNFALSVTFEDIREIDKMGPINGYVVDLFLPHYNISRRQKTSERYMLFKDVGTYKYTCAKVAGFNLIDGKLMAGPFSQMACAFTSEAEPVVSPNVSKVISTDSSSLQLFISKPSKDLMNGVLREILLVYNLTEKNIVLRRIKVSHQKFFTQEAAFLIEINGLKPYTLYQLRAAYVTVTNGSYSTPLVARTMADAPIFHALNVSVNASSKYAEVSWNPIPQPSWNGPPSNYSITTIAYFLNNKTRIDHYEVMPFTTRFNCTTLKPYTTYEIGVSACTNAGCTKNEWQKFNTMQDVPEGAIEVNVTVNMTCIHLQWGKVPLMNRNGIIIGYFLSLNATHNYSMNEKYEKTLCHLYKGFRYTLSLKAATIIGYGEKTFVRVMTEEDVPCAPSNISVFNQYGRYMQIWWEDVPWYCKNGDITGFVIFISEYVEERYFEALLPIVINDPQQRTYKMYGLSRDLFYRFKVAASTRKGVGNTTRAILDDFGDVVDGSWSTWTQWTPCSVSCGAGRVKRKRFCSDPPPQKGKECVGKNKEEKSCAMTPCIGYYGDGSWTEFSPCTATCGLTQRKYRTLICSGEKCDNNIVDSRSCGLKPCPQDGNWGEWGAISACNRQCGGGNKTRTRKCNNPAPVFGGKPCMGPRREVMELCNTDLCPQHGGWGEWEEWSACDKPCGFSKSTRRRACDNPVPLYRGKPCPPEDGIEINFCYLPKCRPLEVQYFLQFTNLSWYFMMYDKYSSFATPIVRDICENYNAMNPNRNITSSCHVNRLSRGVSNTVMGNFSSRFEHIDGAQLVLFVDKLLNTGMLQNMHVGVYSISLPKIPCAPPYHVKSVPIDGKSVLLSWKHEKCPSKIVYVMYSRMYTNEWNVKGVDQYGGGVYAMKLGFLTSGITYKAYLMHATDLGVGPPSRRFLIMSQPAAPTEKPKNLYAFSPKSSLIFLQWKDIALEAWSGDIGGYVLKYKKYKSEKESYVEIPFGYKSFTLYDLQAYTLYMITIAAYNQVGNGPLEYINVETAQDVPSASVPNIHVENFQSTKWWSVQWNALPADKINGILLGYELTYFKSHESDKSLGGELAKTSIKVNKYTFYHKVKDCHSFETYTVTVSGYTIQGNGPSIIYYAKTCRCTKYLFANFYHKPPYVEVNSPHNLTGFFPEIIRDFVIKACGNCEEYGESILRFYLSRKGKSPNKGDKKRLIEAIDDDVDISFPYYASRDRVEIIPGGAFVALIPSPGLAVIVRDEILVEVYVEKLIYLIVLIWPYLVVTYGIATIFGFLIWFTDQFTNPEEFKIGKSKRGPFIGFWFSFVTMTTIGYGDISPRSFAARFISVAWFITGLVLNSIMLAYLTSTFTLVADSHKINLYNTKVGTLNRSFEYRYAVRKNAKVLGNCTDVPSLLDDLKKKVTDVVLVDIYNMIGHKNAVTDRKLIIKNILNVDTAYGFILSGKSRKLKLELDTMVFSKQQFLTRYTKSIEKMIPSFAPPRKDDVSGYIFSKDSTTFQMTIRVIAFAIAILSFIGILSNLISCIKKRVRVEAENHPHSLKSLKLLIDSFPSRMRDSMKKVDNFHDKELWRLISLKNSVRRYVNELGKDGTAEKISNIWHNRLLDYAYADETEL